MAIDLEAKLAEIFSIVLDLPSDSDPKVIRQVNCEQWDSLATVSLVAAVESELGLMLQTDEHERFTSYQSVLLLLREKGL